MAMRVGMEKSNFNLTCSLLGQYLKQKGRGSLGDLNLTLNRTSDLKAEEERPRTMNLLSDLENRGNAEAAPMTMFYGGRVMVFNNFPVDKAEELFAMVGRGSSAAGNSNSTSSRDGAAPTSTSGRGATVAEATAASVAAAPTHAQKVVPSASDLPIARRASVRRFLEKRKDRITSIAPYQPKVSVNNVIPEDTLSLNPKDGEKRPWLGLAPSKLEEIL